MNKYPLITALLFLFNHAVSAETAAMAQAKTKLKQVETKISDLQHTLHHAHDKQALLNKELANTEKKISTGIQQSRGLENEIKQKQRHIAFLQQQVNDLSTKLHTQQNLLAKHLRARYTMGEYQPLKWLLNQDDHQATSRLLTFYQYIVQSRQHAIDQVNETKKELITSQSKLHQQLLEQQQLQQQLSQHQQQFEQEKRYHTALIRELNQDIQSKQQSLTEYQQNKNNLTRLLTILAQQSIVQTQRPFLYMQKKLPRPVDVSNHDLQKINQGLMFFAREGTPVIAVSPGKVVFCDWLKGYGLLLILDHGRGFMTLYAHNQALFKQKGTFVNEGEQIASVGHSGGLKKNGLYFEIRQRGKAIPPLQWMS